MRGLKKSFIKLKTTVDELRTVVDFYSIFIVAFSVSTALFVVDYYDLMSRFLSLFPKPITIVILASVSLILILLCRKYESLDALRLKIFTKIDGGILAGICITVLYFISYSFFLRDRAYKWIVGCSVFLIEIITIIGRIYIVSKACADRKDETIKLQDLMYGKIAKRQHPIVISEKVDTTDLLGRDAIVNILYRAITAYHKDRCYTIGLEGSWGSGKTTVIEIAKEKLCNCKGLIIVNDFDPWLYKSEESILIAAYETILQKTGIRYNPHKIQYAIQSLHKIISTKYSIFDPIADLFVGGSQAKVLLNVHTQVAKFLERENKTVLFIMDNFDRASTDAVLSIFKFISLLLNCPGIIYLLSYDKNKLDKDFARQGDFEERFYEKIIDQEINLPDVSRDRRNAMFYTCFNNLLNLYDENPIIDEYKEIYNFFVHSKIDIRQFKRYINTVFPIVFSEKTLLDKKDLLTITTIRFFSPNLYLEVSKNRQYYITSDIINYDLRQAFRVDKEEFQKECKQYYADLEKKFPEYVSLLQSIFPGVGIFGFSEDSRFDSESYQSISRKCNICSGKYFDLYFCYGSNHFTSIKEDVEEYIELLKTSTTIQEDTRIRVSTLPPNTHKEFAERLQLYIGMIDIDLYGKLANALYSSVLLFDSSTEFLALCSRERIIYVISLLLMKCDQSDFTDFLTLVRDKYDRLGVLQRIYQEIKNIKDGEASEQVQALCDTYQAMCEEVVLQKIDIYSNEYYQEQNIWSILESGLPVEISGLDSYVQTLSTPKNVYRILWDCVSKSIGSKGYGYSISKKLFSRFFEKIEVADSILELNPPQNESESIVLKLYEMFKNPSANRFKEEKNLFLPEELSLTL